MAFSIRRLLVSDQVDGFRNSREPEIQRFLREQAFDEQNAFASATYVLVDDDDPNLPVGFYAISPTSIRQRDLPTHSRPAVAYSSLGAFLLGRMGVDDRYQGRRLGTALIAHAYKQCLYLCEDGGGIGLAVDPKNDRLIDYYADHGFVQLEPTRSRRMFIATEMMAEIVRTNDSNGSAAENLVS